MSIRVALVGCGAVAQRLHIPGLRAAGADIAVFTSRTAATAEAAAAAWGSGAVETDWRAAVGRDDIDAVVVCLPNALHAEVAVAAAEAGKHVLVEKPMATTVEDADRMMAAATEAGIVLLPAHNVRFAAPFVAAREIVAAGTLGDVTSFRAAFGHAGPEAWAPGARWFRDPSLAGGGALVDLGVHVADLLRSVLGDEVVEVAAMIPAARGPVEDAATVVARVARGAVGVFQASWVARPGPDHQLTIFGTAATLHVDQATPLRLVPAAGGEALPVEVAPAVADPCAVFVAAVEDGAVPPVTAEDGRAAVAIVCAAYRAAATGRTVPVEPGGH